MHHTTTTLLAIFATAFIFSHVVETQMSYRVSRLQLYPEIFRFKNGQAVVYYKQMGRGKVNVFYNGTLVEKKCQKIRFIYGNEREIMGFWKKCSLPDHHGVFLVKAVYGRGERYVSFDKIEF